MLPNAEPLEEITKTYYRTQHWYTVQENISKMQAHTHFSFKKFQLKVSSTWACVINKCYISRCVQISTVFENAFIQACNMLSKL